MTNIKKKKILFFLFGLIFFGDGDSYVTATRLLTVEKPLLVCLKNMTFEVK